MPHESTGVVMAYLCACGKKWSIARKTGKDANTSFRCDCGRSIVVHEGVVYATDKTRKAERR